MKKCNFCGEQIQDSAKKCRHCGEWLNKDKEGLVNKSMVSKELGTKTFYWTLIIGILMSIPLNGKIGHLLGGVSLIICAFGYKVIQKRHINNKNKISVNEIIIGILLSLPLFFISKKYLVENPLEIIGIALFGSYYFYPLVNNKFQNIYVRIAIKTIVVLLFLIACLLFVSIINYFQS